MPNTIVLLANIIDNLTPCIPLSFKGGGEELFLKGLHPFNLPLINNPLSG
jgi:hypothetical protein